MPQDFTRSADDTAIDQQTLKAKQDAAKARGEVMPFEKVTVYATQKTVDMKGVPEINEVGHPMEVHPALADKLIASGKATKEKPANAPKDKPKEVKELLAAIKKTTTIAELNALIVGNSSTEVNEAAEAQKKTFK